MGLKLRLNLFHRVSHEDVFAAFTEFYAQRGQPALDVDGDNYFRLNLREQDSEWTVLELDGGWEWNVRREAQLYVSEKLGCSGFLVFVYDGDYWGYEHFRNGSAQDWFVQAEECPSGCDWFPGRPTEGNPAQLADQYPWLSIDDFAAYLIRDPLWASGDDTQSVQSQLVDDARDDGERDALNVPPRPGDQFRRFDECAVLDFLRALRVRVELRDGYVTLLAPAWRSFWIGDQSTHDEWQRRYHPRPQPKPLPETFGSHTFDDRQVCRACSVSLSAAYSFGWRDCRHAPSGLTGVPFTGD